MTENIAERIRGREPVIAPVSPVSPLAPVSFPVSAVVPEENEDYDNVWRSNAEEESGELEDLFSQRDDFAGNASFSPLFLFVAREKVATLVSPFAVFTVLTSGVLPTVPIRTTMFVPFIVF